MSAAKKLDYDPENMTVAEAAEYLGVAIGTLYNMRYKGLGPKYRKAPGGIRYRMRDLDQWKNQNTVNPEAVTSR